MTELTVTEAAVILGVTPGRVRQLVAEGRLPAVKRGRDLFLPRRAVEKFAGLDRPVGRPPK